MKVRQIKQREESRRPNTICDFCSKLIYRRPSVLKINKGKFCSRSCRNKVYRYQGNPPIMIGKDNPAWKGGITYKRANGNYKGTKYVCCPKNFLRMARKNGYVAEHRLIMAQYIGRILLKTEVVHHIDHNPMNNIIDNLMLFPTNRDHKKYEAGKYGN